MFDDFKQSQRFLDNLKTTERCKSDEKRLTVAAVILNLDSKNHISQLLQSLHRANLSSFDLEVVVVDNGSKDGSIEVIRNELKNFYQAHLIVNRTNLGASHGRNQALKYLLERVNSKRPDYILTLDNDTVVGPQVIADLVHEAKKSKPEEIVFAPLLHFAHKPERRQANWWTNGCRLPVQLEADWRICDPFNNGKTVDGVSTAAALIKSMAFNEIGYFDDRLFFGLEDTEWFLRARTRNYEIKIVPVKGKVLHDAHQSLGGSEKGVFAAQRVYYVLRNMILMMTMFSNRLQLRPFNFFKLGMHILRYSVWTLFSLNWLGFKAIWIGIYDGICRRTGPLQNDHFKAKPFWGYRLFKRPTELKNTVGLYFLAVGISTILLSAGYTLTIDWSKSNLLIAIIQTLIISFLLWAVSDVIIQLFFLIVPRLFRGPLKFNVVEMPDGIPTRCRSLIAYMLKSKHISECEEAFANMFRSYLDNLDPNGNVSAVLVSASSSLSIVQQEMNLRDDYRNRIRSILTSEAKKFRKIVSHKKTINHDEARSDFWLCHFHRWQNNVHTSDDLDRAIKQLIERTVHQFKYLHRTCTTLKKAGQYQDLMLLCARGIDRPFTYLEDKYGSLGRSSKIANFGFHGNIEDDQVATNEDLSMSIQSLELRGAQDINDLRQAGKSYGTKYDVSYRYTALLDSDNRIPVGTLRSLIEIAAGNPNRGFLQVGILPTNMETWYALRAILAHRAVSRMPEAIFRALYRFGAYGKGIANNEIYINKFIGTLKTPKETLPLNILSHDTIEALYLNPAYAPNLHFYEKTALNTFSRQAQLVRWSLGDLTNAVILLHRSIGQIFRISRKILRKNNKPNFLIGYKLPNSTFTARYIAHLSTRPLLQTPLFLIWILIETFGQKLIIHTNPLLMKFHFYVIILFLILLPKFYAPSVLFGTGIQLWLKKDKYGAKRELSASLRQYVGAGIEIVTTPFNYMPDILLGPIRLFRSIYSLIEGNSGWKVQAQVERETQKISFLGSLKRTWHVAFLGLIFAGISYWYGYTISILFAAMLITWLIFPVTAWLGAKPISSKRRESIFISWLLKDFDYERLQMDLKSYRLSKDDALRRNSSPISSLTE